MQAAITFYTLTMAAVMLLGAKLGDIWGRRRAFVIGSVVYALGSLITALAPNIVFLFLGWSVVEGLGAVLVIPAIAALVADNYRGSDRVTAFAIIGAVSGAAVAAVLMVHFLFNPSHYGFYPRCILYRMTGIYCPGCGALRASHQLIHGHFLTALRCNALLVLFGALLVA